MVIFFSGTGNSRYVAQCIADGLQDKLVDMRQWIGHKADMTLHNTRPLVFVMPVYVSAPPVDCLKLLNQLNFLGNKAAYFVMTCAGGMGASPIYCQKLAAQNGLDYMGTASVIMPQNYLVYFKTKTSAENETILNNAKPVLEELTQTIAAGKAFNTPKVTWFEYIATELVVKIYYKWFISAKKFRVEDACIGCGKCAKVCPLGNIKMIDQLPKWGDHCTHCMACINQCPKDAIEYGENAQGKLRYRGPDHL